MYTKSRDNSKKENISSFSLVLSCMITYMYSYKLLVIYRI